MIGLSIKVDTKGIEASFKKFQADHEKAIIRALNKTAITARADAAKSIRAEGYNIKAAAIKKSFATTKAAKGRLVVVLRATGKPIALIEYGARQTKSGVSVQVKGGREVLRHAFIATMKSSHKGVFERTGAARLKAPKRVAGSKTRRVNVPIVEKFGPSIPATLANDAIQKAIQQKINQRFPTVLAQELAFLKL